MSDSEAELVIGSDLEEESLTRDVESLRELLESEAESKTKQGVIVSTEEDGSTLEQLKDCLTKNRDLQVSLGQYLSEIDVALQQNRKKREQVQSSGRDYIRTICTLHKMRRRRIYFVDNTGKSPYVPAVVNPPCLTRNYYFHDNKWSSPDDSILKKHVSAQAIEVANRPIEEQLSRAHDNTEIRNLKEKMREISAAFSNNAAVMLKDVDPDDILWENVAYEGFKKRRTANDCRQRWVNCVNPAINNAPWTKEEEMVVMKAGKRQEGKDWKKIADIVGTGRAPFSCFKIYQNAFKNSKKLQTSWSKECDDKLREAVEKFGLDNWLLVSRVVGRSASLCKSRWNLFLSPNIRKGRWNPPEDKQLEEAVKKYGTQSAKCWKKISSMVPGRSASQCRERWVNILSPDVNVGQFSVEENMKLMELCSDYETKGLPIAWSKVALELPNRTDSKCCSQWQRLTTPDRIMKNYELSKMKEKIKTKVKGRKSQLALDFKDFDADMIPEDLKEEAKTYGATITQKKLKRSPLSAVHPYLLQFASAMQENLISMDTGTVSSSATTNGGARRDADTPILVVPRFPEASLTDQAATVDQDNPFPVGPRFITGIVNTQSNGSASTASSPVYLQPFIAAASAIATSSAAGSTTTGQLTSMEVLQSFYDLASSLTSTSSSTPSVRPTVPVIPLSAVMSSSVSSASAGIPPIQSNCLPLSLSSTSARPRRPRSVQRVAAVSSSAAAMSLAVSSASTSTRPLILNRSSRPSSLSSTSSTSRSKRTVASVSSSVNVTSSSVSSSNSRRVACVDLTASVRSSTVPSTSSRSQPVACIESSTAPVSFSISSTSSNRASLQPVTDVLASTPVGDLPVISSLEASQPVPSIISRPSIRPTHSLHSSISPAVSLSIISLLAKKLGSTNNTSQSDHSSAAKRLVRKFLTNRFAVNEASESAGATEPAAKKAKRSTTSTKTCGLPKTNGKRTRRGTSLTHQSEQTDQHGEDGNSGDIEENL